MTNEDWPWQCQHANFRCTQDEYNQLVELVNQNNGRMYVIASNDMTAMTWAHSQVGRPVEYVTASQLMNAMHMAGDDESICDYKLELAKLALEDAVLKLWLQVQPQSKDMEQYIDDMITHECTQRELLLAKVSAWKYLEAIVGDSPEMAPQYIQNVRKAQRKLTIAQEIEAVDRYLNHSKYDYKRKPSKSIIMDYIREQYDVDIALNTFNTMIARHKEILRK